MKITYHTGGGLLGTLSVTIEAATQVQAWTELAEFQEVFEASPEGCGLCGCTHVAHVVRENAGHSFYELHCLNRDCRARKSFGLHKGGETMFPHRKDKHGAYLPNNGWVKWEGVKDGDTGT